MADPQSNPPSMTIPVAITKKASRALTGANHPVKFPRSLLLHGMQSLSEQPDKLVILDLIHTKYSSTVYSGRLELKENSEKCSVAVKFGKLRALLKETDNYAELAELQGTSIPIFYGLFVDPKAAGRGTACIVLEYCGAPLPCMIEQLTTDDKASILNHLFQIHRKGMLHLDVHKGNVLQKAKKTYRIIDLGRMQRGYKCNCDGDCDFRNHPNRLSAEVLSKLCWYLVNSALDLVFYDFGKETHNMYCGYCVALIPCI
ncbi:hypothetical protein L218DRAFT_954636 [Marasmius fiardii PR-910]|nr:hypothetical protein L218DRAFT_954636 [Marasmius fiardii PR-910]